MINTFSDNCISCNTMTLNGQGVVSTTPDTVVIHLGVSLTGEDLGTLQKEVSDISQNILQALAQLGVSQIKTYEYTINKNFVYEDGKTLDKGYIIRNIFEIKLNNLDQAGVVLDQGVNNGANVVDLMKFQVSNPEFYYQQALNLAISNAIQKAKSIGAQLRVPMDPVPVRITENSNTPRGSAVMYKLGERDYGTSIEPGEYQIEASVTVEFFY